MAYSVELLDIAEEELDNALEWYSDRSQKTAQNFLKEYLSLKKNLEDNPLLFPEVEEPIRKARFRRTFPYSVFFYIKSDKVIIVSVFHDKRDPRIWQERI